MEPFQDTSFGYKLLAATYILPSVSASTEYKVVNGNTEDDFRLTGVLSHTCVGLLTR